MTLSVAPADAALAATTARRDHIADLGAAREFFNSHPRARIPDSPLIQVHLRGANRDERLADLRAIADSWGVALQTLADGTQTAQLVFGGLTYVAYVGPVPPARHEDYLAGQRALTAVAA